jgi:type III pantothenate kinase
VAWLRPRVASVQVLESYRQLPLVLQVDVPQKVGIDRLLNAVAANTRRPPGRAAAIVDAGSAVTVDLVDTAGVFRGGAIFPGLRLMAQSLHEYTALLPLVAVDRMESPPGRSTAQAIRAGVSNAVIGGVQRLIARYREQVPSGVEVYVTGGDGRMLIASEPGLGEFWPAMTLAGILQSVLKAPPHG